MEAYPLSPLQQGILFHWLVDRHSGTDLVQVCGELHEAVDAERLEQAWRHAASSFDLLRTSLGIEGGAEPLQRVEPAVEVPFSVTDLRETEAAFQDQAVEDLLREDRRAGVDLTRAPAWRVRLARLEDRRVLAIWTVHQILVDGPTIARVLEEVFACYDGRPIHSDHLPYRHYLEWVARQETRGVREFWRTRLAGFGAPNPLPFDDRPRRPPDPVGTVAARLSPEDSKALRALTSSLRVTMEAVVSAAWGLVQSRHVRESDVLFGVTRSTRDRLPGGAFIPGLALTTVPMRIRVDPGIPVRDWIGTVHETAQSTRAFELLPLSDVRTLSEVPSTQPLFRTLVMVEDATLQTRLDAVGWDRGRRRFSVRQHTGFPLTIRVYEDPELLLELDYDATRYERSTAERLVSHLRAVMLAWTQGVAGPVGRTPMLTDRDEELLLRAWQGAVRAYPAEVGLAELVQEQVRRTSDAPAVTFGGGTLTYQDLNRRANRLARALRANGAGPDTLVGISMLRSLEMSVALLAVIKAGAAYVPLDPALPRDRIDFMIRDSGLTILLTQTEVRRSLPEFDGVILDLTTPTWAGLEFTDLDVEVGPERLAYAMYTSGTTGRPKGVAVPRSAFVNFLHSMREWLGIDAGDRVLAVTPISFDIAGLEFWLPWLVGAHVVLAPREAAGDGAMLRALLDSHRSTLLQATPVSWRQLLAVQWPGDSRLQALCGGEPMPHEIARGIAPRVRRLWNLYGPTETTVWSTGTVTDLAEDRITIGRPIANTLCYVLDDQLQPVPIGAVGELWIGGEGVARGYLNRPELTRERFRADPFTERAAARMYRTGDLARWDPDGRLECLGRVDDQVKVRGLRIELGEIESVLQDHASVRQAVVVAREDGSGDKRLVAYFTPEGDAPDAQTLQAHLRGSLPDYMVPTVFVALGAIPLSANGKVDRRALPDPAEAATAVRQFVRPRTPVELQLTEIWEEVFGVPRLGVTDDFFEIGGHSILAVRIMAAIVRVFGRRLPLNSLFEAPTIERLALEIEDPSRTHGQHHIVSVQASGARPPLFWVPGGAALGLFRFRNVVTELGPDQPVFGLGSRPPKALSAVESVEERARSYLELVRRARPTGPYLLAGFCDGGLVAYEMAQLLRDQGEEVMMLGLINCSYPRYEDPALRRVALRALRLRQQIADARENGQGLTAYVLQKVAHRRQAHEARAGLEAAEREVSASGFTEHAETHNELLLAATERSFSSYEPRSYAGRVTAFISDDEAFRGVLPALDARLAWHACAERFEVRRFPGGHVGKGGGQNLSREFASALREAIEDTYDGRR